MSFYIPTTRMTYNVTCPNCGARRMIVDTGFNPIGWVCGECGKCHQYYKDKDNNYIDWDKDGKIQK